MEERDKVFLADVEDNHIEVVTVALEGELSEDLLLGKFDLHKVATSDGRGTDERHPLRC